MIFIILFGLLAQTMTFPKNNFQQVESIKFQVASGSLVNLVQTVNKEVTEIMINIANKTAEQYTKFIPILINIDVTLNKAMTEKNLYNQFKRFLKELQTFKNLENLQLTDTLDFVEHAKKVEEILTNVIATPIAYSNASWEDTRNKIIEAFKNAKTNNRVYIAQVLDSFHKLIDQLAKKMEELLKILPVNIGLWANLQNNVRDIVGKIKIKIIPTVINKIESAKKVAEIDFISAIMELNSHPVSLPNILAKVQLAVGKLETAIKDVTIKFIEQSKPKVIDALQNLKKVITNAAKQIFIDVNGAIAKDVVGQLTDLLD